MEAEQLNQIAARIEDLAKRIADVSLLRGEFTLRSGRKSNYYLDKYRFETQPDVLAALKRLSVRQRAVIHLTYWADLTPQQVADTIGTSLRTVERELTNARTRLETMLS